MGQAAEVAAKTVDMDALAKALAKAVCDGDIVNLRLLFLPFSPGRKDSSERFEQPKYRYLLPDAEQTASPEFLEASALVRQGSIWDHVVKELEANRPAQLPWELVMALGDRAVALGKYTAAAQAYEMLRIRARMQEEFFSQALQRLDAGDVARAARGLLAATGLDYDYAAFPEPLPRVPDFQIKALMIHGEYPATPDDCLAAQPTEIFVRGALAYLLHDPATATRLDAYPLETRAALSAKLVRMQDPQWDAFAQRYREAIEMAMSLGKRLEQASRGQAPSLADEIAELRDMDPMDITAKLLGRTIVDGEWWQYLKELAYLHPASVLFIVRQVIGEHEILIPRFRPDNLLGIELGLIVE